MHGRSRHRNPFYVLLASVGACFAVTAFAYAVMTFQATAALSPAAGGHDDHPLWTFLSQYGDRLIGGELALLCVLTVAAIGTDEYFRKAR